jgi:hypothetical protein|tara:strand:- start:809 stop:1024 length:216 start_codon:yes stop_codon:yes gene_type:complete
MKIELKTLVSFVPMLLLIGVTYGTFNTKVTALENKVDSLNTIQSDVAIIKEKIMWMEKYLVGRQANLTTKY